jgi:four helix bundle protein
VRSPADAGATERAPTSRHLGSTSLDHERLEVYRVTLELQVAAIALLPARGCSVVRAQLERSATSVVLNIAEGAGRTARADKRRFYEIARGSVTETAAALDLLRLRGIGSLAEHRAARSLAARVAQMLWRLCAPPRGA